LAIIDFLGKVETNIRHLRIILTARRVWHQAEAFLRKYGYAITYEEFWQVFGGYWEMEMEMYRTLREKTAFTIHEAVELGEVKRMTGKLMLPADAPKAVLDEAHRRAEIMERKYLGTS